MTKNDEKLKNELDSTLELELYSIYDTVLQVFEAPFVCRESEIKNICTELANNVSSKYYYNLSNYEVYYLGCFNEISGTFWDLETKQLMFRLDSFLDENRRKIQIAIQTLNYLPNGYFKMPDEMKKGIQEKIDQSITDYCEEFIENNPSAIEQYSMSKAGV